MTITETKAALYDQLIAREYAQNNINQLSQHLHQLLEQQAAVADKKPKRANEQTKTKTTT